MDKLRAEIRREAINSQCDEMTGATVELISLKDVESFKEKPLYIEFNWPDYNLLTDISIDIYVSETEMLHLELDVKATMFNKFCIEYTPRITECIHEDEDKSFTLDLSHDLRLDLEKVIIAYAKERDVFSQYEGVDFTDPKTT